MDVELNLHAETVRDAPTSKPMVVSPDTTVRETLQQLEGGEQGSVLVCEANELVGIFTERDALQIMATGGDIDAPVREFMVTPVVTVRHEDTMATVIMKMSSGGFRRLPILDGKRRPVGILKASGVLRYLVEHFPSTVYTLPEPGTVPQEREGP